MGLALILAVSSSTSSCVGSSPPPLSSAYAKEQYPVVDTMSTANKTAKKTSGYLHPYLLAIRSIFPPFFESPYKQNNKSREYVALKWYRMNIDAIVQFLPQAEFKNLLIFSRNATFSRNAVYLH